MHASGDFITSGQQFNTEFWGLTTAWFMDYLVNDLGEKHWDSLFSALDTSSTRAIRDEAIHNGITVDVDERVPLPLSDPPSPACDN